MPDRLLARRRSRQLLQQLDDQLQELLRRNYSSEFSRDGPVKLHLDMSGLDKLERQDLQMVQDLLPRWASDNVTVEGLEEMASLSRRLSQHLGGTLEYDIAPLEDHIWGVKDQKQCTICRGCTHVLEPMPTGTEMLGSYYTHEQVRALELLQLRPRASCWPLGPGRQLPGG